MGSTEDPSLSQIFNYNFSSTVPIQYRFIPGSVTGPNYNTTTNPYFLSINLTATLTNATRITTTVIPFNNTGYFIEEEADGGLTEFQTVFLACVATFILLIIIVIVAFGLRVLWRKYRRYRNCNNYNGEDLKRENKSEDTIPSISSHFQQMKCSETQISIADEVESCNEINQSNMTNGHQSTRSSQPHIPNTNGSKITMTLKNNHLIVETEERNDIEEDSRETKVTYSPGDKDGAFVVEVQQGNKRSPGSGGPSSCTEAAVSTSISDQCALIHNPPDRFSDEENIEELESTESHETIPSIICQSQLGLSQSNGSICSATQTYSYGNQQEYGSGRFGYPVYNGYDIQNNEPIFIGHPVKNNPYKPKIISEIYKSNNVNKTSLDVFDDRSKFSNDSLSFNKYSLERGYSFEIFQEKPDTQMYHQMDDKIKESIITSNFKAVNEPENPTNSHQLVTAENGLEKVPHQVKRYEM